MSNTGLQSNFFYFLNLYTVSINCHLFRYLVSGIAYLLRHALEMRADTRRCTITVVPVRVHLQLSSLLGANTFMYERYFMF